MPPACSPDELFAYLDSLGIAHRTVTHPPMFKVEDGRTLRDRVTGGHTKNLFLRDKKGVMFLVVAPAQAAIELKSLHRLLGASGRFSAMMRQPTLNFHPLINTGTTTTSRDGLLKFLEATGHRPRIEPVSGT
jgi:Ala-tRNA(Pro) deacylase